MTKNFTPLLKLLLILISTCFFVVVSYYFFDRTVAWFVYDNYISRFTFLKICVNYPRDILQSFFVMYFLYALVKVRLYPLVKNDRILLGGAITVAAALFIKDGLKFIFGRYWPEAYICNNPSLIGNNAYGFHFFTSGSSYASFPSGHSVFIAALAAYFWNVFPSYRWLYSILVAITVLGLLGMNYHFLSDIIAGIVIGCLIGQFMYVFLKRFIYDLRS